MTLQVLLVDDEPDWLYAMSISLERAGVTNILTCDDSRQVLHMLAGVVSHDLYDLMTGKAAVDPERTLRALADLPASWEDSITRLNEI